MNQKKENSSTKEKKDRTKTSGELPSLSSFIDQLEQPEISAPIIKYPKINASLGILERFLTKNFMLILGIYALTVTLCGGGLLMTNVVFSSASGTEGTTGNANVDLSTWLYSIIAVFTFFFIVAAVFLICRRRLKDKSITHGF